jgi:2-oxoglutarate ferredoxin oxidoreductase subunit delta
MRDQSYGTLVVDVDKCKGCELCIPACPIDILVMSKDYNELGYHYPLLEPGCTGCTACQQVCPDFVFEVYKYDKPLKHENLQQPEGSAA